MKFNILEAQSLLKYVLECARKRGAEHAVAVLDKNHESTLRFALNETTQHMEKEESSMSLSVALDHREAIVEGNSLTRHGLEELASRAVDYALASPQNPEFFTPVSSSQSYSKTQTWFESTANLTLDDRARAIQSIFEYAKDQGVYIFGNLNICEGVSFVENSSGLSVHQDYTNSILKLTAKTMSGGGSGKYSTAERDWHMLDSLKAAERAVKNAKLSSNPTGIGPGQYTVVLAPQAVIEYLTMLLYMMDQRRAERGHSFFSNPKTGGTRIGEKLFDDKVFIRSLFNHPRMPEISFGNSLGTGGSSTGAMFSFGLPMENHTWVEKGVLKKLPESAYWARKNGREAKAVPMNIVIDGTDSSIQEIIQTTPRGIYISSLWYNRITDQNTISITGLTRDGTYLIENGRISRSLFNFRFNDSPVNSLNHITALSKEEKVVGEFVMGIIPYMRIDGFNLTSVSEAV